MVLQNQFLGDYSLPFLQFNTFHLISAETNFLRLPDYKIEDILFIVAMVTNSWVSAVLKIMKKSDIFLKISNWYCVFEIILLSRSLKWPLMPNFSLIYPKTKRQWRFSTLLIVATSEWQSWHSTFELQMTSLNFLKISQGFYPSYIPTKLQHLLTWIRKMFWKICLFNCVFSH